MSFGKSYKSWLTLPLPWQRALNALAQYADEEGWTYVTISRLAEDCAIDPCNLRTTIRELTAAGWVIKLESAGKLYLQINMVQQVPRTCDDRYHVPAQQVPRTCSTGTTYLPYKGTYQTSYQTTEQTKGVPMKFTNERVASSSDETPPKKEKSSQPKIYGDIQFLKSHLQMLTRIKPPDTPAETEIWKKLIADHGREGVQKLIDQMQASDRMEWWSQKPGAAKIRYYAEHIHGSEPELVKWDFPK